MDKYIYAPPPPPPSSTGTTNSGSNTSGNGNFNQKNNNGKWPSKRNSKIYNIQQNVNTQFSPQQQMMMSMANPFFNPGLVPMPHMSIPNPRSYDGFPGNPSQPPKLNKRRKNKRQKMESTQSTTYTQNNPLTGKSIPAHQQKNWSGSEDEDEDFEDEEALAATHLQKKTVVVPGTSITLNTQEDIEKWIAERRKKWPTDARVEQKNKVLAKIQNERLGESKGKGAKTHEGSLDKSKSHENTNETKRPCHSFSNSGKCPRGSQCKYSHIKPENQTTENTTNPSFSAQRVYKRYEAAPKIPLYLRMMREGLETDNNKILDIIEYLYLRDF